MIKSSKLVHYSEFLQLINYDLFMKKRTGSEIENCIKIIHSSSLNHYKRLEAYLYTYSKEQYYFTLLSVQASIF